MMPHVSLQVCLGTGVIAETGRSRLELITALQRETITHKTFLLPPKNVLFLEAGVLLLFQRKQKGGKKKTPLHYFQIKQIWEKH